MKKNRWVAGILLVLFVTGLVIGIWQYYARPGKVDFDKVGGTILVYEIVPPKEGEADADLAANMAKVLEKRLDPDSRGFASVRPTGKDRVEIRIAKVGNSHAEDVARAKELLATIGQLEFRILANSFDDEKAMKDAVDMLNARVAADQGLQMALKNLQEHGLPPSGPRALGSLERTVYDIKLPHDQKSQVTYGWVELGPQERSQLGLEPGGTNWEQAEKNRGKATKLREPFGGGERFYLQGVLFYSRACADRNLPEPERKKKAVDYFVLARDPELDPKMAADQPLEKRRTPKIDGGFVTKAYPEKLHQPGPREVGDKDRWAVNFSLDPTGKELFRILTKKNVPSPIGLGENHARRHLAIILDGQVMSAPTINSEIPGGRGMITGDFTEQEIKNMARVLNAGALPARLKPAPVSETAVPPK